MHDQPSVKIRFLTSAEQRRQLRCALAHSRNWRVKHVMFNAADTVIYNPKFTNVYSVTKNTTLFKLHQDYSINKLNTTHSISHITSSWQPVQNNLSKTIKLILQHVFKLPITYKNIENNNTYSTQVKHQTNIGPSAITKHSNGAERKMTQWTWEFKRHIHIQRHKALQSYTPLWAPVYKICGTNILLTVHHSWQWW